MADVQKIISANPIKIAGGVYHVGIAAPTSTSNAVDENLTILGAGAQNAGGNVADTYPGETCIVTSDGTVLSKNAADCWVLPVNVSGVSSDTHTRGLEWLSETSGAVTVDWSVAPPNKAIVLADDATLTFTAPTEPGPLVFMVDQGATGSNTITWPELSGSTPVLATGANQRTVVNLFYDGTYYHV